MPYPTVNLEVPPKPAPSPVVDYVAFRKAFTHDDRPCSKCGKPTERFADAVHADGSHTGWVPVCEACVPTPKADKPADAKPSEPAPAAPVTPAADASHAE